MQSPDRATSLRSLLSTERGCLAEARPSFIRATAIRGLRVRTFLPGVAGAMSCPSHRAGEKALWAVRMGRPAGCAEKSLRQNGIGHPFTESYARQTTPKAVWQTAEFRAINRRISAVWGLAFLVRTVSLFVAGPVDYRQVLLRWSSPSARWPGRTSTLSPSPGKAGAWPRPRRPTSQLRTVRFEPSRPGAPQLVAVGRPGCRNCCGTTPRTTGSPFCPRMEPFPSRPKSVNDRPWSSREPTSSRCDRLAIPSHCDD